MNQPAFPLPVELLTEIIKYLRPRDQLERRLSLVSQLLRKQTLPFIFVHLRYTGNIVPKIHNIHQAGKDVKGSIKNLELKSRWEKEDDDYNVVFQFFETLPNLRTFDYHQIGHPVWSANLSRLIDSVRHAPLRKFVLHRRYSNEVDEMPTLGLAGLESLFINWNVIDFPQEPGSSLAHLHELIRPSLTTLVELKVDSENETPCTDLNWQLLRAAGDTLRSFECTLSVSAGESILITVPEIFPRLTKLAVKWDNSDTGFSLPWKHTHINFLLRNKNLTDLTLSSNFESNVEDIGEIQEEDFAWYVRCYERRLKATQDVVSACPRLQHCRWVQLGINPENWSMVHPFVVEEQVAESKITRIVRGVKQAWMGRDHEDFEGCIVKCKLEDLPGDIIGENDAS